jgi:hypothetical protein
MSTLHGGRLNGENGVRFKKVGNLMTIEPTYTGGAPRTSSLNKSGNSNLFLRNIFNEQLTPQNATKAELEQL